MTVTLMTHRPVLSSLAETVRVLNFKKGIETAHACVQGGRHKAVGGDAWEHES